ncbi:MAG: hypothetical protein PHD67_01410 [Oscillospiraceae bacterium]|nr:hypothetical protein [Oscillospiraceae bacterium]
MTGKGVTLGGGTRLNYEVTGGTAQPESPKENTIWVNTGAVVTDVIFSVGQPSARTDGTPLQGGEIFVKTGNASNVPFKALLKKDEAMMVYPQAAYQWDGSAWVRRDSRTYQNGGWKNWGILYYDNGDEFAKITGGISVYTPSDTATKYDTYIHLGTNGTGEARAYTNGKVDLSAISTLQCTLRSYGSRPSAYFGVLSADPKTSVDSVAVYHYSTSDAAPAVYSLDVSALTGEYYLYVRCVGTRDETASLDLYKLEGIS